MKRISTIILRCAVFIASAVILALCVGVTWLAFMDTSPASPHYAMAFVLLFGVYASAIPFFIALFHAYKLLMYIDAKKAFSASSVAALTAIKRCAITIFAICTLAGMPFFYYWAQVEDAPGIILFGSAIPATAFVIAVFASVLSRLFRDAWALKTENDHTI